MSSMGIIIRKILGIDTIGKSPNPSIREFILVRGLKHKLLSISQLSNKGKNITFDSSNCRVIKSKSNKTLFNNSRSGDTYTLNLNKITSNDVCLVSKENEQVVVHKYNISYPHGSSEQVVAHKDLIDNLPDLHFKRTNYAMCVKKGSN